LGSFYTAALCGQVVHRQGNVNASTIIKATTTQKLFASDELTDGFEES
jgi:hypothetical protein